MRRINSYRNALLLVLALPGCAARAPVTPPQPTPAAPTQPPPPAPTAPAAPASPLAGVDVFGTRAFTAAQVRAVHGADLDSIASAFASGRIDEEVIARYRNVVTELRSRGDFAALDLSVVTYFDRPQPTLYITVDVVERADSARRMAFGAPPADTVPDPAGLVSAFVEYDGRAMTLLQQGQLAGPEPPCPVLHCAPGFHHETLRAETERFVREVPPRLDAIARVLHRDADPARRAAAAFLLGYADDPQRVADALAGALGDPESGVRNNALRVLVMLANREPPVAIPLAPVITALHFPATTDRNKAAYVLLGLAKRPGHRRAILEDAGPVLLDMLALEQPNNRDPAHAILRELSGLDHPAEDLAAWRAWWRAALER